MARVNPQGLSRRCKPLMSSIIADPGYSFVSVDLVSGEPTCTTHFSKDKYYRAAAFDMVGKAPYWDGDVLMIDDIYLMTASVSPMGRDKVKQWWADGLAEKWLVDAEGFKARVKADRQLHKVLCLGLSYGMGPKKLIMTANQNGYELSPYNAKQFFRAYWELFAGVRRLSDRLIAMNKRDGHLVTEFGYRLVPGADYKCLNAYIQSSVSGIISILVPSFYSQAPYCKHSMVVHDEAIFQCPTERLDEAKQAMERAVKHVNELLGWSVDVRTGWAVGSNLYEAK